MEIIARAEKPVSEIITGIHDESSRKLDRLRNELMIEVLGVALQQARNGEIQQSNPNQSGETPACWLRLAAIQQELQLLPGGDQLSTNFCSTVIQGIARNDPRLVLTWLVGEPARNKSVVA